MCADRARLHLRLRWRVRCAWLRSRLVCARVRCRAACRVQGWGVLSEGDASAECGVVSLAW
eukprot:6017213-Prymnesium_polylepis.1